MELKSYFALDNEGNSLPEATCYLYERGSRTIVSGLRAANDYPLANPFTADAAGMVQFVAPNGVYDLRIVKDGRDYTISLQCNDVTEDVAAARSAASDAGVARDAAMLYSGAVDTVAEGLAKTEIGKYFSVPADPSRSLLILYRNNGTEAQYKGRYPSADVVENVQKDQKDHLATLSASGQQVFKGNGAIWPLLTDIDGRVLFGINQTTGRLFGRGLVDVATLPNEINLRNIQLGEGHFIGSGPVWPFMMDINNKVVLGFDQRTNKLVGAFPTVPTAPKLEPLNADLKPLVYAINHLLFYGQSVSIGAMGTPVISTTQPYANLTFNGGPRAAAADYSAFKPLVEDALAAPDGGANRGETPCSGAANYASELAAVELGIQPSEHVILSSTAGHGAYSITQLNKGTAWYQKVIDHASAGHSLAAAASKTHGVPLFGWIQGETDTDQAVLTQVQYRDHLAQLRIELDADIRAITGQTQPVLCVSYQVSYGIKKTPNMALAQLELVRKNPAFFLATPCYHLPFATDNTHLTAAGYKWLGAYFGRAYKQLVHDGSKPKFINPLSATSRSTTLTVRFAVPYAPLQLDTSTLAITANHGFLVKDDTGTLTLSDIKVVDQTTVQSTVNRALGANPQVRYAMDNIGAGLTILNGASGNLRDSEPATVTINSVVRPLYNVCPHFQLPIIPLS